MADLTFQQIIDQVANRLNRDDLEPNPQGFFVIQDFLNDRWNYYAKEFFYNAQFQDQSIFTVQGLKWYDLPTGWEDINFVRINLGGVWLPLTRFAHYDDVLIVDAIEPPIQSLPSRWTTYQNPLPGHEGKMALRLFPTPFSRLQLELTFDGPPRAPVNPTDSNFWTQDAQTLSIESAAEAICKLYLNDPVRAEEHKKAKEDEETALGSKTIRIRGGIRVKGYL